MTQPVLFGWCSTGHHSNCRVSYITQDNTERKCECQCHETK